MSPECGAKVKDSVSVLVPATAACSALRGSHGDFPKIHPNTLTPGNRIPPPTGSKLRYTYGGHFPCEKTEVFKVFSLRLHRQISLFLIDEKPSLDKQNA